MKKYPTNQPGFTPGQSVPPLPQSHGAKPAGTLDRIRYTLTEDMLFRRQVLILAIIGVLMLASYLLFGRACFFQLLFGLPCPGCGMLHAGLDLFTGNFSRAMAGNPCILLWVPFLVAVIWCRLTGRMRSKWLMGALIVVGLVTIGVYIWRMMTIFPAWPLDTYEHSLFGTLSRLVIH